MELYSCRKQTDRNDDLEATNYRQQFSRRHDPWKREEVCVSLENEPTGSARVRKWQLENRKEVLTYDESVHERIQKHLRLRLKKKKRTWK
jgi:hypothetical protein